MKWLPNALTILRCILAFVVGWAILEMTVGSFARAQDILVAELSTHERSAIAAENAAKDRLWALLGFFTFIFAAVLDFLDGWLARKLNATSEFGKILDPIADKLLVGIPLIIAALLALAWLPLGLLIAVPCLAIVIRDIAVTLLRFSKWGGKQTNVSRLAKWKTALEFVAVGLPLAVITAEQFISTEAGAQALIISWIILLVLAAVLSIYTGYQYVRAATSSTK